VLVEWCEAHDRHRGYSGNERIIVSVGYTRVYVVLRSGVVGLSMEEWELCEELSRPGLHEFSFPRATSSPTAFMVARDTRIDLSAFPTLSVAFLNMGVPHTMIAREFDLARTPKKQPAKRGRGRPSKPNDTALQVRVNRTRQLVPLFDCQIDLRLSKLPEPKVVARYADGAEFRNWVRDQVRALGSAKANRVPKRNWFGTILRNLELEGRTEGERHLRRVLSEIKRRKL
jgi:hypothetical protein